MDTQRGGRTHNMTQRADKHTFTGGGRTHNVTQRTDTQIFLDKQNKRIKPYIIEAACCLKITTGENCHECSPTLPRIVAHHPMDGPLPSKICSLTFQKMVHRMVTNLIQDGKTPSRGLSPTNCRMVNHHPWDGYHFSQDGHQPFLGSSTGLGV